MTKIYTILPMIFTRKIYVIVFDGFELLDMAGPVSVFSKANSVAKKQLYNIHIASAGDEIVLSQAGIPITCMPLRHITPTSSDTVLVVGAEREGLQAALRDKILLAWLGKKVGGRERFGSICTGAFLLAEAGLLDGHKATTHWAAQSSLAKMYNSVSVDTGALYVQSGNVWTSAGVATGIDMALAILEADHGKSLKHEVAKQLVVYAHRPGNQSQFSKILEAQALGDHQFSDLLAWIDINLNRTLQVSTLAEQAGMSERSFFRKFKQITGKSPLHYVETVRLQRAKSLIEGGMPLKQVGLSVGYNSEQSFRSAFEKLFGVTPAAHLRMTKPRAPKRI